MCFTFWHPCGSCLWGNLQIYPVYWLLISCKDKFICFCIKLLYYLLLHYLKIKILIFFFAFDHLSDYGLVTTPRIFGIDLAWTMFFFTQEQTRAKQQQISVNYLMTGFQSEMLFFGNNNQINALVFRSWSIV